MKKKIFYVSPQITLVGYTSKQILCQSDGGAGEWEENEFTPLNSAVSISLLSTENF